MSTTDALDALMEEASVALAQRRYLDGEERCVRALEQARLMGQWDYYARILMPLQECRRHRRMIASEGMLRLGTAGLDPPVERWLEGLSAGCFVLTAPHGPHEAAALQRTAQGRGLCVEILLAECCWGDRQWTLHSGARPQVALTLAAPPEGWLNQWIGPGSVSVQDPRHPGMTPADWFIDATEALGDVALAAVHAPLGSVACVLELEGCLAAVTDHEIIHQRLAEAAHALAKRPS